jgi:hypothetical protein
MQVSHTTETDESQLAPGSLFSVHSVPATSGHEAAGQAIALLQSRSHRQASAQSTNGQDATPLQSTVQAPLPQWMPPQEAAPEQLISQPSPSAQSISPHAPALLQRTSHSKPSGHFTLPHGRFAVQSIRQVRWPMLQELHSSGHSPLP